MPKQLIILGLVLLLYFWPWQLFSGDQPADWLLSVLTMQALFVIACNFIVRDSWVLPIIIIESFCMIINMLYAAAGAISTAIHGQIVVAAVILELLVITSSMGAVYGGINRCHIRMAGRGLWGVRRPLLRLDSSQEGL